MVLAALNLTKLKIFRSADYIVSFPWP